MTVFLFVLFGTAEVLETALPAGCLRIFLVVQVKHWQYEHPKQKVLESPESGLVLLTLIEVMSRELLVDLLIDRLLFEED